MDSCEFKASLELHSKFQDGQGYTEKACLDKPNKTSARTELKCTNLTVAVVNYFDTLKSHVFIDCRPMWHKKSTDQLILCAQPIPSSAKDWVLTDIGAPSCLPRTAPVHWRPLGGWGVCWEGELLQKSFPPRGKSF